MDHGASSSTKQTNLQDLLGPHWLYANLIILYILILLILSLNYYFINIFKRISI